MKMDDRDAAGLRGYLEYERGCDEVPFMIERAVNMRPYSEKGQPLSHAESVMQAEAYADSVRIMVDDGKLCDGVVLLSRAAAQAAVRVLQAALANHAFPWVGDNDYGRD